jgi:hypothetical protein
MTQHDLEKLFFLNPPADMEAINEAQKAIPIQLPQSYKNLLLICNGLHSSGCMAIHEIEDMPARNADYEVATCMPGFFMIGDDGGGQGLLINEAGEVYEAGMGVMDPKYAHKLANSLKEFLIDLEGKTRNERL